MAKNAYKRSSRLPLPWERSGAPLASLFTRRRLLPLAVALVALALAFHAHETGAARAKEHATRATLVEVERATRAFVRDFSRCPEDTSELVHPPKSGRHYLNELPVDAWGRAPQLRCLAGERTLVEVLSAGPSGSFLIDDNVM